MSADKSVEVVARQVHYRSPSVGRSRGSVTQRQKTKSASTGPARVSFPSKDNYARETSVSYRNKPKLKLPTCPQRNIVGIVERTLGCLPESWQDLDYPWIKQCRKPAGFTADDQRNLQRALVRWMQLEKVEQGEVWLKWRRYKSQRQRATENHAEELRLFQQSTSDRVVVDGSSKTLTVGGCARSVYTIHASTVKSVDPYEFVEEEWPARENGCHV
jgi:hypothetical protein